MSHTTQQQTKAPTLNMTAELLTDHFPEMKSVVGDRIVYLLRADLAGPSGSFKDFGVETAVSQLAKAGHSEVSTASAGSHALAMVEPCIRHGLKLHVLLPTIASVEKQRKIPKLWASLGGDPADLTVTLVGADLDETHQYVAHHLDPATFVHAYDNVSVIDGRREIRRSAERAVPTITDMVVPVGGGSLFTALTLEGKTWGVEAEGSDSLSKTLRSGSLVPQRATSPNDKFGGCTVRYTGENVVKLLSDHPHAKDRLLVASNAEVQRVARMYQTFEPTASLEPTSLVAVAGLLQVLEQTPAGAVIGVVGTGRNERYQNLLA
jgi:threonine dehydratase